MKIAMGALAVLATIAGFIQTPLNDTLHNFLEPTFRDSHTYEALEPSDTVLTLGLIVGAGLGLLGIFIAYQLWVVHPERPAVIRARFAALHKLFVNKWYFDEANDLLFVRPAAWLGRFCNSTIERRLISGLLVGGTSGAVRAASAAVRGVQTGYLRYYAALLLVGLTGLGAYFLISA
jgi:NADH-quinone oxidoreductase subunit L